MADIYKQTTKQIEPDVFKRDIQAIDSGATVIWNPWENDGDGNQYPRGALDSTDNKTVKVTSSTVTDAQVQTAIDNHTYAIAHPTKLIEALENAYRWIASETDVSLSVTKNRNEVDG